MKKFQNLYIAATSQHVGKTTCTLGLLSAFKNKGINVGYCKPVGQKFLDINNERVDKDALLFSDSLKFDLFPEIHSPVILGSGATTAFLENPTKFKYGQKIDLASEVLTKNHELTIYEGTGHPGVGSVVNLSNADVAHRLNAKVLMIVEGGIGNTIDMLSMTTALFREKKVPILGVIINKVLMEKADKVRHYCDKWLVQHDIPLLGLLPYDPSLAYPLLRTIVEKIDGLVMYYPDKLVRKVVGIVGSSIIDDPKLLSNNDLLLIVSMRRVDDAIKAIRKLSKIQKLEHSPLAGIIATAEGNLSQRSLDYIHQHRIPFIRTRLDTYGTVIKINRIEVKINTSTPWKVERAIQMINQNVDLSTIIESCKL